MIRLSRKAWNNVLIFSMLIMIILFNGLHKKLGSSEPLTEVSLLPANSLLLTLKFEHTVVERIGQGWRTNPAMELTAQQLEQLMTQWLTQKAQLFEDDSEAMVLTEGKMPQYFVVAALAGKSEGNVYAFYPQLGHVLIHDQQQQRWLKLLDTQMPLLFLPELTQGQ